VFPDELAEDGLSFAEDGLSLRINSPVWPGGRGNTGVAHNS
jgi:hypothetical protein